ncbi:hypothetical protein RHSIM_Rhsim08G0139600 [Rhododendron simsii]|uniref:Uncharacterized protein n=1 Tax=Rhododendron simsii TaxID=118357 RepID=A0A834LES5_RHOSS|nr:hypothetical protein RHSIM_Rhsim08G0139600 [Rhododendron simsii]
MEGRKSEAVFDAVNLNPQLFINEAVNCVRDMVDDAFDYYHQVLLTSGKWCTRHWISQWHGGRTIVYGNVLLSQKDSHCPK